MSSVTPTEILARLQAGEDPAALAAMLLPDRLRTALRYAAPLRWLTANLWERVVQPSLPEAVTLDDLQTHGLIRELPRERGTYLLADATRAASLAEWAPDELRHHSAELALLFGELDNPREQLYHLMLADRAAAVALFEQLFDNANDIFDLTAARDLLDLFERPDRRQIVDDELGVVLADRRAYLDTRTSWSTDYYRSAGFLERTTYRSLLEELLSGTNIRALQLVAGGGKGKTMLLRSFIARRCIPARTFVARIDFDHLDAVVAANHPWLILIALARQLNEQSPVKPFDALLNERARLLPALYGDRGTDTLAAVNELSTLGRGDWLEREVIVRYEDGVARLEQAGRPIVFVFDTTEVPVLRTDLDSAALIRTLFDGYRNRANARLVLAGRYDVFDKRPDLEALVRPGRLRTEHLADFTLAEGRRYLSEVRGIDRPEIVEAILAKGDLMPFTLALYGDLVSKTPELTAADVEAFDNPQQQYLIEKVLERIDNEAVKYAVRYGVVARRLDKGFLTDVLMPYIVAALARRPKGDDPGRDPHDRMRTAFGVGAAPIASADPDDVWQLLASYASSQSWVSFVQDGTEYLSFHVNVRTPMRLVLKEQAALRLLHEAAYTYFRSLMASQPLRLVQWAEEAAYHGFYAHGADGERDWRDLLAEVERAGGPSARGDLAAAVTADEDLSGDTGLRPASWFGDQPVMSMETLAETHLEVALARLSEPMVFGALAWNQVELRLATVRAMEKEAGRPLVDDERRGIVELALRARTGSSPALDATLARLAQIDEPTLIGVLAGIAISFAGSIGADRLAALQPAEAATPESKAAVHSLLASLLLAEGDTIRAAEQASEVARADREDRLSDFYVWLANTRGEPTRAARLLEVEPANPSVVAREGRALLVAQQPDMALAVSRRLTALDIAADSLLEATAAAAVAELEGRVFAALGTVSAAIGALDLAAVRWRDAGDLLREADVRATTARILLDEGRVSEASRHLDAAESVSVPQRHDLWITTRLLRVRWLDRSGRGAEAGDVLEAVLADLARQPRGPVALARAAVEGLARDGVDDAGRRRYLDLLMQAVSSFRPYGAALAALDGLDRCAPLVADDLLERSPLDELMGEQVEKFEQVSDPGDEALRQLRLAELARLVGAARRARTFVENAARAPLGAGSLIRLRTLESAARIGRSIKGISSMALEFAGQHEMHPALAIDAVVAWARASQDDRWIEHTDQLLSQLERTGSPSRRNAEVLLLRADAARAGRTTDDPDTVIDLAGQLYRSLGDVVAAQRLVLPQPRSVPSETVSAPSSWRHTAQIADVLIYERGGELVVEGAGQRWQRPSVLIAERWQPGTSWFRSDVSEFVDELAGRLAPVADSAVDTRLRIASPQLAELPWELGWPVDSRHILFRAAPDGGVRRVMRVQRALTQSGYHLVVDGVIGPQTERAMAEYQARLDEESSGGADTGGDVESSLWMGRSDQPTALILQLSHRAQITKGRSRTKSRGVAYGYQEAGFETVVVEDPTSKSTSRLSLPCSVVHVQASLESSGGVAYLSFNSGTRSPRASSMRGDETLSVTALHELLMRLTTGLGPVVVLEAVAPESRLEAVRQVLLRNLFASQLFELGFASAVLATGPVPDGADGLQSFVIAPALAGRRLRTQDIGDLQREIRRSPWQDRLQDGLAMVALFAEDPAAVRLQ